MSRGLANDLQVQANSNHEGVLVEIPGSLSSPVQIPELIEEILSHLVGPNILSAVRVCKTWSDPALNQLWRNLSSLVPLLSLIGPIQCQNGEDMDFIHDIHGADWSRYAFYARRVRNITLADFPYQKPVSVHAVQKFVEYIPSHLATSLVTSITTFSVSPTPLPLQVVPFISQSLRKLKLKFSFHTEPSLDSTVFQSMLAAVRAAATLPNSSLEELDLSSHTTDTDLCVVITNCLAKHRSTISKLSLYLLMDHQVWSSIYNLPFLREVAVSPFKSSELGESASIIPMIQELVKAQPLLERFCVSLPASGFGPPEGPDLYGSIIRQLLGLHNLRSVAVYASAFLLLSENDIREMGVSWPHVRAVRLQPHTAWSTPGQLAETDLSTLPSFLRHFPCLEELDLPFRCDSLPPAEQPVLKSVLRVLEVSGSPVPRVDVEQVAAYLASVLPPTTHVKISAFMIGGDARAIWHEIIRRVKVIRDERSQNPTNALQT
ncbi:hypothetical protein M407DRAFT_26085 [Tulasnella calospora MUT 4182]|uniref:F-box domain-containing protein n=1 Tax=Tulasnella calospora MUT 4182 TaxID=1051891 RepID=A0A0C3LT56_9AGAM|nr:hypothetical protein M407DRAFT_26085 [Tulasnella calospora MUT 4182]